MKKLLKYAPTDLLVKQRIALIREMGKSSVKDAKTSSMISSSLSSTKGKKEAPSLTFKDFTVPFDSNKYDIREDAKPQLNEIGKALQKLFSEQKDIPAGKKDVPRFEIAAHTDEKGTDEFNLMLSEERAKAVKSYLVQHFKIPDEALIAQGYGNRVPLCKIENSEECHAMNRRIEIVRMNGSEEQIGSSPRPSQADSIEEAKRFSIESAQLYKQGHYQEAILLAQRSLVIMEKELGPDHPDVALSLSNLAVLYNHMGDYAKAEPLNKRSLAIYEKALGPDHPDVALSLSNLAAVYDYMGAYTKAEPLYKRSLAIYEKALGPGHPDVAASLNNLAQLYDHMGDYAKAEPLYKRSLAIWRRHLALTIHMSRVASTTWLQFMMIWVHILKQSPYISAPWRSMRRLSALTTRMSRRASTTWLNYIQQWATMPRPSLYISAP